MIGKASTIDPVLSPTPPIIFYGGQKVRNLASFQHHSNLSRPRMKMQRGIRTLKQNCNAAMIALYILAKFDEVGSVHPCGSGKSAPPTKIARRKRVK